MTYAVTTVVRESVTDVRVRTTFHVAGTGIVTTSSEPITIATAEPTVFSAPVEGPIVRVYEPAIAALI